ncbi:MAG: hypothetical protein H6667_26200 [Ardenticatenaceae bacterium]|nr:hypothetical protein [Ardenticatenaceae bacterium]MCB9444282.1 hypothetical protein [Ardenticatenaceae bacterium]
MKQHELIDLLADHADALNRGEDVSVWLAEHEWAANISSVLVLLQVAEAVKRALVPAAPSLLFRSELKNRLLANDVYVVEKRPFPKTLWLGAAVSVIGLVIFLLRRIRLAGGGVATAV